MSWGLERTNHGKRGTNSELANELKALYFVGPHDADAGLSVLGSHTPHPEKVASPAHLSLGPLPKPHPTLLQPSKGKDCRLYRCNTHQNSEAVVSTDNTAAARVYYTE